MNWLTNVVRPKIRNMLKRETPENLWIKCPDTGQLVFYKDVESNQFVIPGSNYHMRMSADARMRSIFDNETWYDVALPEVAVDPLKFRDERKYVDRIKDARAKTGLTQLDLAGSEGTFERLGVSVGEEEFDPLHAFTNHVINCIAASTADADHLDDGTTRFFFDNLDQIHMLPFAAV